MIVSHPKNITLTRKVEFIIPVEIKVVVPDEKFLRISKLSSKKSFKHIYFALF
jgi:hypothetical protein